MAASPSNASRKSPTLRRLWWTLWPPDHSREGPALLEPPLCEALHVYVVRDHDTTFGGRTLEVNVVVGALRMEVDGSDEIPPAME